MADSPNVASCGVLKLTVFSGGEQIDATIQIVSVSVKNILNKIPVAKIILLDGDMPSKDFPVSNTDTFKPGSEIKINAGYDQDEQTIFEGVVIKHGIKVSGDNDSQLVIECRDKAVAMTVGRQNANYVDAKDSDVIATLIASYSGLSADVQATTTVYKELVQYYCTDWDFMLSRAEVNGLLVSVDAGKVTVKTPQVDVAAELKVAYGDDLIEFQADLDSRHQLAEVKGVSWDIKNQAIIEEQVGPVTLNKQGDIDSATLAGVIDLKSFRLQTVAPMEKDSLKQWATGQQLKAGLSRICGRMKFQGSAKARSGGMIELEGVGNRFNGSVFITAVRHEIGNGNWLTEAEFGMTPEWLAAQSDVVAPAAAGVLPGVEGLQIGVVKKLDADPDGQYKVQVSVPLMQATTEGVWARLLSFYGSLGIGAFFVPEIGDEVVLGYFNNDPSSPVILGSLYSSSRKPPYELTADNFIKALVTKSNLKIEFDDENKIITLTTPANNKVVISDKDKSILLQDQNNNKVELGSAGIVLDSPKDIKISAKGKITLDAVDKISISSKADVDVAGMNVNNSAQVGFVAKGNASAELSASGQTTVKGAMVMIN